MSIAVSIVTYHTPDAELERCFASLRSEAVGRITVIDNSRCEATALLCSRHPEVEYVANNNTGYGAGHNIALRRSIADGFDYHLVVNSDVEFAPSLLADIERYMDAHPGVGCLQPRIVNPDGSLQHSARLLPTPFDLILRRFIPKQWFKKRRRQYELHHLDPDREWNIPYHQGSFMFLRCATLKISGLFDERFFMYPEDIDLSRRIHSVAATMYWPGGTVVHDHRAASYGNLKMLRIHALNMVKYFNKWGWLTDPQRSQFNRPLLP